MSPMQERPRQFNVRLSDWEIEEVKEAAAVHKMTASDFVRYAVGLMLQTYRLRAVGDPAKTLPPEVEGKMRLADLARWDAERATRRAQAQAKPPSKSKRSR